jgi:hypothetical protein
MPRDATSLLTSRFRALGLGLILALLAGAWPPVALAQSTRAPFNPGPGQVVLPVGAAPIVDFTLREFPACPVPPRDGSATAYSLPGNAFATGIGASFGVGEVCVPNPPLGGIFDAGGQGFGDLVAVTPGWPFGPPPQFRLCDPDADETFWFIYGDSLDTLNPGLDRFSGINFPHNNIPNGCTFDTTAVEGMWFVGRRNASRQAPDIACQNRDPAFPIRVGNALFCELFGTWVVGDPPVLNPQVNALGFKACNFYALCGASPVGGDVAPNAGFCGNPAGPLPANILASNVRVGCFTGNLATANVLVTNAINGQPLGGVTVSVPGLSPEVTGDDGRVTITSVPTGAEIAFTATHPDFRTTAVRATLNQGQTQDLAIAMPPPGDIAIVLSWLADPRDLDAHLTTPTGHVYYGNPVIPGATLNHDSTQGYGPETITVTQISSGKYSYSVHHFAGDGTICSSGASVQIFVGAEVIAFQPPGGCTGDDDEWHVFDFDTVTGLVRVQQIIPGSSKPAQPAGGSRERVLDRATLPAK